MLHSTSARVVDRLQRKANDQFDQFQQKANDDQVCRNAGAFLPRTKYTLSVILVEDMIHSVNQTTLSSGDADMKDMVKQDYQKVYTIFRTRENLPATNADMNLTVRPQKSLIMLIDMEISTSHMIDCTLNIYKETTKDQIKYHKNNFFTDKESLKIPFSSLHNPCGVLFSNRGK